MDYYDNVVDGDVIVEDLVDLLVYVVYVSQYVLVDSVCLCVFNICIIINIIINIIT